MTDISSGVSETNNAEAETAKPEQPETTVQTSDSTAETEDKIQQEAKPERTFTQAELDEAVRKRESKDYRKVERQIRAEVELQVLREQREQAERQSRQDIGNQPSGEPKPEQFKTYEEYLDKLTDYKMERKLEALQREHAQRQQAESQSQYEARIRDNLSKAADKYDDFEDVIASIPAQYVTPAMVDAIGESEIGGEISYYLGQHHKEAAEIAKLSNVAQVKAIDRLEAKLKAPAKVSEAPPPANVVGKGKATQQIDLNTASLDEYMKARQKQGARWANR